MTEWLRWLSEAAAHGPAAMVSVLATEGSAPRGTGTRMLVTAGALSGTIGGGQLEYRAVEQARAILAHPPGSWRVQDYPLGPLLGQCCGGRVRLLIEQVDPDGLGWMAEAVEERILVTTLTTARVERRIDDRVGSMQLSARGKLPRAGTRFAEVIGQRRRPLYLFGAGHVGQAIVRHVTNLPFRLAWFDTRAAMDAINGVTIVPEGAITGYISEAPADAAVLVLTHDHGLDYALTKAALKREPLAFVGLIGSATKRARFLSRLEGDGVTAAARLRLTSPIGIAGVCGKEPDVIAIATLAQLLQLPSLQQPSARSTPVLESQST